MERANEGKTTEQKKRSAAMDHRHRRSRGKGIADGIMNLKPSLEYGPNPHPQDADGLGARSHRRSRACAQVRQVARRRNLRAPSKAAASNPQGLLHQPPLDPPPHRVRPMPMPMPMPMSVPVPMPMHNRPRLDILMARVRRARLRLMKLEVLFLARRVLRRRLPLLPVRVRVRWDLVVVVLPASSLLPLVLVLVLVLRRVPTRPRNRRGVRVLTVRVRRLGRGRLHLWGVRERVPARERLLLLLLLLLRLLWLRLRRRVAQDPSAEPARRRRSRVAAHDARGHERRKHRPLRAVAVRDAHRRRAPRLLLLLLLLVRGLLRGVREVRLRVRVHGRLCLWLARVRGGERWERPIVHLRLLLLLLLLLLWLLRLLWRDVLRLGGRRRM